MLCFETGKSSENECFTTFLSFKLFAISLQVVFNVILHEVTVSARTVGNLGKRRVWISKQGTRKHAGSRHQLHVGEAARTQ